MRPMVTKIVSLNIWWYYAHKVALLSHSPETNGVNPLRQNYNHLCKVAQLLQIGVKKDTGKLFMSSLDPHRCTAYPQRQATKRGAKQTVKLKISPIKKELLGESELIYHTQTPQICYLIGNMP